MTERRFCYICGSKVQPKSQNSWWCDSCQQEYFDNPRATAEVAIFNDKGEVLLAERAFDPWQGKYDLPGGFMETNESAEDTALREIEEELGLAKSELSELVYVASWPGSYPWGKETYDVITTTFTARLLTDRPIKTNDDVAAIKFVSPTEIIASTLSAEIYDQIIKKAEQKINDNNR